jgi:4-amino-4-deoxy-L-arabinose transferase-like glycosyltransferase
MTRTHWLVGLLGMILALFLNLDTIPLFDLDEGAFSEATREMLAGGDFLTTYLDGELRFDKPILIYWLQAAAAALLGLTEGAMRLPSALAALAWAGITFAFGRRHFGTEAGAWAAFFLVVALQPGLIAKAAIADALLNLWLAGSLFAIYLYYRCDQRRWLYAAYAAMALGMLTKGPVALLIPVAVSLLFALSKGEWRRWFGALAQPGPWLVFLGLAAPWYLAELWLQGWAFVDGFFLKHNISRFQGPMEGHAGSLLYYVPVVLLGTLPFTALVLRGLRPLRELWRGDLERFLLLWFGFVFVFFSLSGTKLPHYLVYGLTPLFLLAGRAAIGPWPRWHLGVWAVGFLLLLAALPAILAAIPAPENDPYAAAVLAGLQQHLGWAWTSGMLVLALAALAAAAFAERRAALLGVGLATVVAFHGGLLPMVAAVKQEPIRKAGQLARQAGAPIHLEMLAPSFLFYARSTSVDRPMRPGDWVLTEARKASRLPPHRVVMQRHGVLLAEIERAEP